MTPDDNSFRVKSDKPFVLALCLLSGSCIALIVLLVAADVAYSDLFALRDALANSEIQHAIKLSLISCTLSSLLSIRVAVPTAYIMSRFYFRGKALIDTVLDIPIVLPPLVVGVSLLVLFNFSPFEWIGDYVVLEIPAVIIAQFMVACAFAVRTMRVCFDEIPQRYENVALTLGCNRAKAFWAIIMPQAWPGVLAALTLAWARSLGEFGPVLIFAGSTRMRGGGRI